MMNTKRFTKFSLLALIGAVLLGSAGTVFAAGAPIVETNNVIFSTDSSMIFSGSVNPNDAPTTAWFEYGTSVNLGLQTSQQSLSGIYPIQTTAVVNNLQPGSTYYYRAVAENSYGRVSGPIRTFNANGNGGNNGQCAVLTVTTNGNPSVNGSNAVVTGTIFSNNGSASYTYYFQYGANLSLSQTSQSQSIASGYNQVNASLNLNNLAPNTSYSYRLVAQNQCGNLIYGLTYVFTTNSNGGNGNGNNGGTGTSNLPPVVTTQSVSTRNDTSATMTGLVNPNGNPTTAWFEYGTSASNLTKLTARSIGDSYSQVPRSTLVLSLRSGTTYFYRLVAQNSFGTSYGQVLSFTTTGVAPAPTPTPTPAPQPEPTPTPTSTVTNPTGAPVIVATPVFSKDSVKAGDEFTYTLTLKNNGSAAANNVSVTLTLPKEAEFVKSNPNVSSRNNADYVFAVGTMNPGDEKKVEVTLQAVDDLSSEITVQVSSLVDYTDASNKRQTVNGSRTVQLSEKGKSAFASIGSVFGRVGNIPGYIWFFIFLLVLISVVTWIFFNKLRGTESAHDDHGSHDDILLSQDGHGGSQAEVSHH